MQDDVPLVVAEVNPDALASHRGIIANPNCSTMQMVVALKPLHDEARHRATRDLHLPGRVRHRPAAPSTSCSSSRTRCCTSATSTRPTEYAHQIAFNALPHAGSFAAGEDHTDEERKLMNETRKILDAPSIRISATCVRVPVVTGHSEAVNVQTARGDLARARARAARRRARRRPCSTTPRARSTRSRSTPPGSDEVFVGRIRRDPGNERALDMWIVSDNLRKGAATNAVQIAEVLHERGLVHAPSSRAAA